MGSLMAAQCNKHSGGAGLHQPCSVVHLLCLALSPAQLCSGSHRECGVAEVIVYVRGVQSLWKMVARVGIPGLSYVSFKFVKGFVHR